MGLHALALVTASSWLACGSPAAPEVQAADAGDAALAPDAPPLDAQVPPDASGLDDTDAGADGAAPEDASEASTTMPDASGPPFACGPSLHCSERTQFCGQVTGPHGGTFYNCNPAPAPCPADVTCACLAAQGIVSPCSDVDGGIVVVAVEP